MTYYRYHNAFIRHILPLCRVIGNFMPHSDRFPSFLTISKSWQAPKYL